MEMSGTNPWLPCEETSPSLLNGAPLQCVKVAGHTPPHEDWTGCTWGPLPKHRAQEQNAPWVAPHLWDAANAEPTQTATNTDRDLERERRVQATIDAANAQRREGRSNLQTSKQYDPSLENFFGGNRLSRLGYGAPFWLVLLLAGLWAFVGVTALGLLLVTDRALLALGVSAIVTISGFGVGALLYLALGRDSDG